MRNSLNVISFLSDHLLVSGECSSGNAGLNPGTTGVHRTDIWTHQESSYTLSQRGTQIFIHIRQKLKPFCLDASSQSFLYSLPKEILPNVGLLRSRPTLKGTPMNGNNRSNIKPGAHVKIVQKQDQLSGKLSEGIVKDVLTKSPTHPHGIKVRLQSGIVGRVKEIMDT